VTWIFSSYRVIGPVPSGESSGSGIERDRRDMTKPGAGCVNFDRQAVYCRVNAISAIPLDAAR
jgi:hypothetical protein